MPLALIIAQAFVTYGPILAGQLATILHSQAEPTLSDWLNVLARAHGKSYDEYIAEANLPKA